MALVRPPVTLIVRDPEVEGRMAIIDSTRNYDSKHALVKAYPDEFLPIVADGESPEAATREPGEKRTTRRG